MFDAYIVATARTAGRVSGWHAVDPAAQVLNALVERNGLPTSMEDVIMGGVETLARKPSFRRGKLDRFALTSSIYT